MPIDILEEGDYELFETTKEHEILVLNGEEWFSIVQGQAGEILVLTDSDHEKKRTEKQGRFFLVDFKDDPKFRDIPHLFLETEGAYEEVVVPQALPTGGDKQKKVIRTGDTISAKELEDYLENPRPAGPGSERSGRPGGGSMANVAHHLQGIDLPARRRDLIAHAKKRDAPKAVLEQLEGLPDRPFGTVADVTKAIGESKEPLPVEDYDELSSREIPARLEGLDRDELLRLRDHEESGLARKTILQQIDEKIELTRSALPIDGYEEMSADEIEGELDRLDDVELREVRKYEESHDARKTVLQAIDRKLEG